MTEAPRRPILKLKTTPKPPEAAPVAAPAQSAPQWKCKPCGAAFDVSEDLAPGDAVRCASCGARLGKAEDFRSGSGKVRARRVGG